MTTENQIGKTNLFIQKNIIKRTPTLLAKNKLQFFFSGQTIRPRCRDSKRSRWFTNNGRCHSRKWRSFEDKKGATVERRRKSSSVNK